VLSIEGAERSGDHDSNPMDPATAEEVSRWTGVLKQHFLEPTTGE
jgi:hypothetical protein